MTLVLGLIGIWVLLGVVHLFATKAGFRAGAIVGAREGAAEIERRFHAGERGPLC